MNNDYQLLLFSSLAIFMWGLWGFFGKLALERQMAPATIFLAEVIISFVCALPILFMILYKYETCRLHVSWNVFGLISGAALAIGLLFYYLALQKGPVSIVVPLTATYPIVSVLLGYMILKEKPTFSQWIGIIMVVTGAVLLLAGPIGKVSQTESKVDETVANVNFERPAP